MMQRCLALARQGWGKTSPNPLVGCVIVDQNQQIIGEGFHPKAGEPHAEVFALREAGEQAKGSTAFVNLEPCNHYGRTPPCTEALISAGIAKVVVGMVDPNPLVAGNGIERLRETGMEVVVGVETTDCELINEAFVQRIKFSRPLGILKYAMTLDGKIATQTGHSAWVTGKASRRWVHHQRGGSDAVVVGGNTVRQDNPHLTTHQIHAHNPLRIVMSQSLDLPEEAHLWDLNEAQTLVFTNSGTRPEFQETLRQKGVLIEERPQLSPADVMQYCFDRGMSRIFWECGGRLAAAAIADGTIQKVMAFIAPKIIGGQSAPSPVGDLGFDSMAEALLLQKFRIKQIESDFLLEGYLSAKVKE